MTIPRQPGMVTGSAAVHRSVCRAGALLLPGGGIIDGSESRDPLNTGDVDVLRAGLLMGKITTTHLWAPSILGVLTVAYADDTGVELTVSVATAVEIVRRIGTSGTFKLTGPPVALGVSRSIQVTYSAISIVTGVITVTAIGTVHDRITIVETNKGVVAVGAVSAVDAIQTITISGAPSAGTWIVGFGGQYTTPLAHNITGANLQIALRLLPTLGDVTVAGDGPYAVSFAGTPVTGQPIAEMLEITDDLSNGGDEEIDVATTTPGVLLVAEVTAEDEVQTITIVGNPTSGTFRLAFQDDWTEPLAYNATAAVVQAALRALATIGAADIAVAGDAGGPYTCTFGTNLGDTDVEMIEADVSNIVSAIDDGRFVAESLVQPEDGSEQPRCLINDGFGIRVTDEDNTDIDVPFPTPLIGGHLDIGSIVNYPSDVSLGNYIKAFLRLAGQFTFSDMVGEDTP